MTDSLPSSRDQLIDELNKRGAEAFRLRGALGDLVDAVVDGGAARLDAAVRRARLVLGRDREDECARSSSPSDSSSPASSTEP